ncbi:hypothetical protein D3C81_1763260 [compost metagenome]
MHPDLMGAAALQLQLDFCCAGIHLLDLVPGQGRIAVRRHDPPVRLCRVAVDRAVNIARWLSRHAVYERGIPLVHRAGDHLLRDMLMAVRILRNYQHT